MSAVNKLKLSPFAPKVILFLFAFLLYANTFKFDFALDDKIVITVNSFTKQGFEGIDDIFKTEAFTGFFGKKKNLVEGGRYRPLTLAYFAVVWDFVGPKEGYSEKITERKESLAASVLHVNNAIFYGLTAVLLFVVLSLMFSGGIPEKYTPNNFGLPFIVTALFIAHPLHTEVVANIKSLDEIWAFLAGLLATYFSLKYYDSKKIINLIYVFLAFFIGSFAKESIVVFLGVIPLTLLVFRSKTMRLPMFFPLLPAVIGFGIYFAVRVWVLGDQSGDVPDQLMNKPFLYATIGEKFATILFSMLFYLKLLVYPAVLTHDYYPWHPVSTDNFIWDGKNFPYIDPSNPLVWISVLLYVGMLIYGVYSLFKPSANKIIGYCALFFVGTFILFSNLFFEIGVFMNERFMYVPSLAFCLLIGWALHRFLSYQLRTGAIIIILALFSFKTYTRNFAWENDRTLSITDYETSKNSAKVNMSAGGAYYENSLEEKNTTKKAKLLNKSIALLQRSIQLYPSYIQSKALLGHACYEAEQYKNSVSAYESGLKQSANFKDIENAIFIIADTLARAKKPAESVQYLEMLAKYQPKNAKVFAELGKVWGKELGNINKAKIYLEKSFELDPNNVNVLENLGVAYGFSRDFNKSLSFFQKALALEPNKPAIIRNIGVTYLNLGNRKLGEKYLARAAELDEVNL